jgi:hypothetical protein
MHRFIHQQRPPQIPATLLRDADIQLLRHGPTLLLCTPLQYITNLDLRRRRYPNQQCSTPNRRNDIRRTVRQQYQPQIRTILLHRPPQRRLRIARKMIRLIDNHDLEPLLRALINLLRLRYLLQQILNNNTIVVPNIGRGDLEMVDRGYDVEF